MSTVDLSQTGVWFTVKEHGIPEIGATVLGGHWYTDPWLRPELATVFSYGVCRVLDAGKRPRDLRDFPGGKQWQTFGPSHNQITHWMRINPPGDKP